MKNGGNMTNQEIAVEIVKLAIQLPEPNMASVELTTDTRGSYIWYKHSGLLTFVISYTKRNDTLMQYMIENKYQKPSSISNVTKVIELFRSIK